MQLATIRQSFLRGRQHHREGPVEVGWAVQQAGQIAEYTLD
jgi:hypothetical protein